MIFSWRARETALHAERVPCRDRNLIALRCILEVVRDAVAIRVSRLRDGHRRRQDQRERCGGGEGDEKGSGTEHGTVLGTRWGREHIRSLFYGFRSWRRHPATDCPLCLACLPRTGATSFADDFAERH